MHPKLHPESGRDSVRVEWLGRVESGLSVHRQPTADADIRWPAMKLAHIDWNLLDCKKDELPQSDDYQRAVARPAVPQVVPGGVYRLLRVPAHDRREPWERGSNGGEFGSTFTAPKCWRAVRARGEAAAHALKAILCETSLFCSAPRECNSGTRLS
jgi:hypothetical protein